MSFWPARPPSRMMKCGFPEWTCLECFHLLDPASWRRVALFGRYNRSRYDLLSCVVEKYASDAIKDAVGSGKAKNVKVASKSALSFASDRCDAGANWEAWGTGGRRLPTTGQESSCLYLILSIVYEICAALSEKNSGVTIDRTGPSRGACFLILFHRGACRRDCACVRRIRQFQRPRLPPRSLVLDRLWVPG